MATRRRRVIEYEEEEDEAQWRWKSGLCHCCNSSNSNEEEDDEECLCVIGACVCPCAGYAWNYAVAVQRDDKEHVCWTCLWPCCVHFALDGAVSALAAHFSGIPYLMLPVGTILRVMQRRVVEKEKESLTSTCVEELFCWGCSIGEMNRKLREREREHLPAYVGTSGLLGTLSEPPSDVANSQRDLFWAKDEKIKGAVARGGV